MSNFDRQKTIDDLNTLREVVSQFLEALQPADWERKTGNRDKDWTVAETLAHTATVAEAFNMVVYAGRRGVPAEVTSIQRREDLREWNAREIEVKLSKHTLEHLRTQLDEELTQAATYADLLNDEELMKMTVFPVYNRPAPLGNFIDWQLSHLGVVHGAQFPRPLDQAPLWERYSGEMRRRQVDRFVRHMSWAYWHTYAPDVNVTYHFHVDGPEGGDWTLVAAPDGGSASQGVPESPDYTFWYAEPGVMFSLFTGNETFLTALKRRELRIEGDKRRALDIIRLFAATPPRDWAG
jgi:hypothetical protein